MTGEQEETENGELKLVFQLINILKRGCTEYPTISKQSSEMVFIVTNGKDHRYSCF